MAKQSKNKNKKIYLVILAAVLVILIIALVPVMGATLKQSSEEKSTNTTVGSVTGSLDTETEKNTEEDTEENSEEESESESETESETEVTSSGGYSYSGGSYSGGSSGGSSGSSTASGISFPYTSSLDGIRLDAIYNYSGYYIEDGSEDEISSVAALEVTNVSGSPMEYATITLSCGGTTLTFEISLIPAGATVLVMEANRQSCSNTSAISYEGTEVAALPSFDMCADQVSITTDENGGITVTNISDVTIDELRLFYKNQLESGEYIGGIAYTVKIESLEAGASQTVYPSHYDPEYGVVMMVRTY